MMYRDFQEVNRPSSRPLTFPGLLVGLHLLLIGACATVPQGSPSGADRQNGPWQSIAGTCGIAASTAWCWGWDAAGEPLPPHPVSLEHQLVDVGGSAWQGCGLDRAGAAFCWGPPFAALTGQVRVEACAGLGANPCALTPARVLPGATFVGLSVGLGQTCGILASGGASCWGTGMGGRAYAGARGPGGCEPVLTVLCGPIVAFNDRRYTQVATGDAHACALDARGNAFCWGIGPFGELGSRAPALCPIEATTIPCATTPTPVQQGNLRFVSLTAGRTHTCGLTTDGAAWCWGANPAGQLGTEAPLETCLTGDIGMPCALQPVPVAGNLRFRDISAWEEHTCAISREGDAWCWGDGSRGQLGQGIIERYSARGNRTTPVKVLGEVKFAEISASGVCGRTPAGDLYCWGIHAPDRDVAAPLRMPDPSGGIRLLSFEESPLPERPGIQFSFRFLGDTLHVEGVTELRCANNTLNPAVTTQGTDMKLWLIARRWEGGGCEETDRQVAFAARLGPIPPGKFRLEIVNHPADDADRLRTNGFGPVELSRPGSLP